MRREIKLAGGVTAQFTGTVLNIKGPKGEVARKFDHPRVSLALEGNRIIITASRATKREKKIAGSFVAHIKNAIRGVQEPHTYKLKICSGHFPMGVAVSGHQLIIKNFLGESVPRRVEFSSDASVKVEGTEIIVTSADREAAGQTAARIENMCRITNRDIRIFQDGCYITHKAGKSV